MLGLTLQYQIDKEGHNSCQFCIIIAIRDEYFCRLRGVILYELQATLACYARRKFSAGEISTDHMKNVMKASKIKIDEKYI